MTKTFKQLIEIDVPKGHEYGPSSRKRPAGKAGYTSSDNARTAHLKTIKKWSKKKRRQGDKEFANEEVKEGWQDTGKWKGRARLRQTQANFAVLGDGKVLSTHGAESTAKKQADGFKKSGRWKNIKIVAKEEVKEAYKKGDSSITLSFKNSIERAHFKSWLKKEKDPFVDFNWSDEGRTDLEIGHIQPDFDIIKYAKKSKIQFTSEESPANATGSAVAGTGDDSSTVLVKKRKELQKRLMRRFSIKETLDKILPDPVEKEDELTTRKNQLKELAKNRNV